MKLRGLLAFAVAVILTLGLVASAPVAVLGDDGDDEEAGAVKPFSAPVTLKSWDSKTGVGLFRDRAKVWHVVELVPDESRVRVDKPVPAANTALLGAHAKEAWILGKREFIQDSGSNVVGKIADRAAIVAGFAIEPLPAGDRTVGGRTLAWLAGTDFDWSRGVVRIEFAPLTIALGKSDVVLLAGEGNAKSIKRGKKLWVEGLIDATRPVSKKGKLLDEATDASVDAPRILVSRLVVLHDAFAGVYPHAFPDPKDLVPDDDED